ncbi:sulfatase family protein [Urbifossiella limnaea]|uniref:Choline-sulfatase n=1 Tax=Urbifossiella limnaea TaxID=2528023 RepID=A0A517XQ44_9BACT|nr:sulfatase [Urbifossiella limnaea]QDU19630.1 Choline-sulfatase [Urbifossiella limnaea]
MRYLVTAVLLAAGSPALAQPRPNIVLIGAEDISPSLGCYGDPDAVTPNLDRFATQGARFTRAFTHAPVCAPSRSGLITGVYPTTLGTHHMRSKLARTPDLFVDYLRKAGYFVAWPGKTDFNFDLPKAWVDTTQDWTKNPAVLPTDRPWFAYINYTVTHESQVRATPEAYARNTARLKPEEKRDRGRVALPPYYPDTPVVRECVGKYHDNITALDYLVGDVLRLLDERRWAENTIVVFFGDHGWGLPRGKRWCYDSGTRIPLLVRWPGVVRPGTVRDDLTAFIDLAPTFLTIAGAAVPPHMQGRVFVGPRTGPAPEYVFSCRDRMDETYDRIRSARGPHFRYVRNFHPELPYAQWLNYLDEMPVMKDWRRLAFAGTLTPTQRLFFARTKPAEELYDTRTDPHEVRNLAADPAHADTLRTMRGALDRWMADTKDLGATPERELIAKGLVRDVLSTEYEARLKLHPKGPPVP